MTTRLTVVSVVGARPNFMKAAPVVAELTRRPDEFTSILVHTGQHYDDAMSEIFLRELGIGAPDHRLGIGSGSRAEQTARVRERLEPLLIELAPDVLLVPGDVNSTLGASLAAATLQIPIGHIKAGLRSFDRTMPEEINRVITDALSELLFVHSPDAVDNLTREGVDPDRVHMVGNTMIDTLLTMLPRIGALDTPTRLGLRPGGYLVVMLHRPSLVAGPLLAESMAALRRLARSTASSSGSPSHTRSARTHEVSESDRLRLLDPIGYLEFMSLVRAGAGVVTGRRHRGGNDVPRHAVLHAAGEYRASDHLHGRHEHAASAGAGADRRGTRTARCDALTPGGRAGLLGWTLGSANRGRSREQG